MRRLNAEPPALIIHHSDILTLIPLHHFFIGDDHWLSIDYDIGAAPALRAAIRCSQLG